LEVIVTLAQLQALAAPFLKIYGPMFLTLLGLTATDVLLGIASALKRGVFHWREVGNFYRTNIVPKLIGWSGLSILTFTVSQSALPPEIAGFVFPITAGAAFAAVVVDLLSSITLNARELFLPPVLPKPFLPGGKVENRTIQPK
jgi:hypothetical protein